MENKDSQFKDCWFEPDKLIFKLIPGYYYRDTYGRSKGDTIIYVFKRDYSGTIVGMLMDEVRIDSSNLVFLPGYLITPNPTIYEQITDTKQIKQLERKRKLIQLL